MTNELEKQFFDTFGIKPKKQCFNADCVAKDEIGYDNKICDDKCVYIDKEYPQITDRHLLELIIILGTICTVFDKNVDDLKENVLKNLIELSGRYHIYNQVRTLFEEG